MPDASPEYPPSARALLRERDYLLFWLSRWTGGMAAQIVTAVRPGGRLRGIISLHDLRAPRRWTAEETELARRAAALTAAILEAPAG